MLEEYRLIIICRPCYYLLSGFSVTQSIQIVPAIDLEDIFYPMLNPVVRYESRHHLKHVIHSTLDLRTELMYPSPLTYS